MYRHTRGQFVAFGLLPLLNTLGLLLRGLDLSTRGSGNTGTSLVVILVAGLVLLACALASAVKRGRDLGYKTHHAILALAASLAFAPLFLVLLAYLCVARTKASATPVADQMESMGARWLWAPVLLISPWMALLVVSAVP
jgi:uncharacterized membrane protein YhaH (DUF805 family)